MGVDRIVDQVVNPKIYSSFLPKVEEVVQHCLKLDDNDKPVFVAPPRVQQPPQPLRFKDRHNLAPRAKVPAPRKALTLLILTLRFIIIVVLITSLHLLISQYVHRIFDPHI